MNTVTASFNTTVRQMTEMSQRKTTGLNTSLEVLMFSKQVPWFFEQLALWCQHGKPFQIPNATHKIWTDKEESI